jgi:hypothetical protein
LLFVSAIGSIDQGLGYLSSVLPPTSAMAAIDRICRHKEERRSDSGGAEIADDNDGRRVGTRVFMVLQGGFECSAVK